MTGSQFTPEDYKEAKKELEQVIDKIKKGEIQGLEAFKKEEERSETPPSKTHDAASDRSTPELEPQRRSSTPEMEAGNPRLNVRRAPKRCRESEGDSGDHCDGDTLNVEGGGSQAIVIPSSGSSFNTDPSPNEEMDDSVIDLTQH